MVPDGPKDAKDPKDATEASDDAGGPPPGSYTIDELAAQTGVPSRTIRFYQAKGALAPPVRRGRIAYYDDSHAERLRLVAHLQDRGLSLRAIRDLFQRTEGGRVSVSQWLGVGEQLRAPWTDDRPRICTEDELDQLIGSAARPGLVADLTRVGALRRETQTSPVTYFIPSPGMLQIALGLERSGVPLDATKVANDILRKQLGRAADELVQYFVKLVQSVDGPDEVSRRFQALRSLGTDAVRLVFAQEIERSLRQALEEGRALPPNNRKKRR